MQIVADLTADHRTIEWRPVLCQIPGFSNGKAPLVAPQTDARGKQMQVSVSDGCLSIERTPRLQLIRYSMTVRRADSV